MDIKAEIAGIEEIKRKLGDLHLSWKKHYGRLRRQRMLTDDDRRLLTELLGEVWDKEQSCPHCGYYCTGKTAFCLPPVVNRTFTTWQDMGDLKKKIVEMGEWDEFIDFTLEEHGSLGPVFSNEAKFYKADYINWLMDPIRFPELVAEWWTERKVKG